MRRSVVLNVDCDVIAGLFLETGRRRDDAVVTVDVEKF
jgi:hypothetical protein